MLYVLPNSSLYIDNISVAKIVIFYDITIISAHVSFILASIKSLLMPFNGYVVFLPTSKMINRDGSITVGYTDNYLLKGLIFRRICASVRVFALG